MREKNCNLKSYRGLQIVEKKISKIFMKKKKENYCA